MSDTHRHIIVCREMFDYQKEILILHKICLSLWERKIWLKLLRYVTRIYINLTLLHEQKDVQSFYRLQHNLCCRRDLLYSNILRCILYF